MEAETRKDFDSKVALWIEEIENAEKHQKKWIDRAKKVVERYRDERTIDAKQTKFNILWSNTEVLKPAVYFQMPKPNVSRRFKDKDPIGNLAAQILERALSFSMDDYGFDSVANAAVEDFLLPGRGVARGIYKAEVETYEDPVDEYEEGAEERDGALFVNRSRKKSEAVECKYWYWEDVIIPKGKMQEEPKWIAFRAYPTRQELLELAKKGVIEESVAKEVPLNHRPEGTDKDSPDTFQQAEIYEIWDKTTKTVKYLCKSYKKGLLSDQEPGLKLVNFYPIPVPLVAVHSNDTNLPLPIYCMYQDQAMELDDLTGRIQVLTEALRVTGAYDATHSNLKKIVKGGKNELIPVSNWAMFAEKGGMKGAIDFFPLQEVVSTLISLYEARDRVKNDLYEISGISDIIRGASDPGETATAQKIKGRFASLRLEDLQKAVQVFMKDLLRIKAEIIADNFEMETLKKMTGIEGVIQTQEGPIDAWPQVMELLRDDMTRSFRIDVETDSTIRADEEENKRNRVEFLEASGAFLERALQVGQAVPSLAPLLGEMLMFAIRGFKVGRELEDKFETAIQQISAQPAPQQQDPKAIEAQVNAQEKQQEMQMKGQEHQANMAEKAQGMQQKQESHQADMMAKGQKIQQGEVSGVTDLLIKQQRLRGG